MEAVNLPILKFYRNVMLKTYEDVQTYAILEPSKWAHEANYEKTLQQI